MQEVFTKSSMGIGDTTMFWKDVWNFGSLQQLYLWHKRFNIPTVECVMCSSGAEET
jgi:hypothetical protein